MLRCAHLLMLRCDSTPACFNASRKRTPKMAPVDPVMPTIMRRIENPRSTAKSNTLSAIAGTGHRRMVTEPLGLLLAASRSALEQVAELLHGDAAVLRRRHVHFGELVAPVERPAGVDDGTAVGVVADHTFFGVNPWIKRRR